MSPHPTAPSYIASTLGIPLDEKTYQSRINPWLLDKLTSSRTELTLLITILSVTDAEPDVASLFDVFRFWERDGAGFAPPQHPDKLDDATLRRAASVVVGDGFDRALLELLFGLPLWDGAPYERGGESEEHFSDED